MESQKSVFGFEKDFTFTIHSYPGTNYPAILYIRSFHLHPRTHIEVDRKVNKSHMNES